MSTSIVPRAGMKRYVTTGGADTSGLNQNSNNMAAWAAIIPAAASLVGSAINGLTGRSNVQMQRETNQMNYQMMHEQNRWNREQWNLENAYNSPSAQSARLRQAGINPNAVFGNGSVSDASSLQSASPNPAVAPQMPYLGADLAQGVYTGINAFNQSQLINAQTQEIRERAHGLSIDNDLKFATLLNNVENSNVDAATKKQMYNILMATKDAKIAYEKGMPVQQAEQTKAIVQQVANMKIHAQIEQDLAKSNIKLNEANIRSLNAGVNKISHEIALIDAQANLTNQQKLTEIEKYTSYILDNEMKGIDNNIKNQLKDTIVKTAKLQYNQNLLNFGTSPASSLTPWVRLENQYFNSPFGPNR